MNFRNVPVFWSPSYGRITDKAPIWQQLSFIDPEPALKHFVDTKGKDIPYLKCPSFIDHYKNTFVLKCPVDIELYFEKIGNNKKLITKNQNQEFFDNFINIRFNYEDKNPIFEIQFIYVFLSREDVLIEQLNPSLDSISNLRLIEGEFNISKWVRGISFAFETIDDNNPIVLKRGQPLCYVRFRTKNNKKVSMERINFTGDLKQTIQSCVELKKYMPGNTMEQNYEVGKNFLNFVKKKILPKKCPFKL